MSAPYHRPDELEANFAKLEKFSKVFALEAKATLLIEQSMQR